MLRSTAILCCTCAATIVAGSSVAYKICCNSGPAPTSSPQIAVASALPSNSQDCSSLNCTSATSSGASAVTLAPAVQPVNAVGRNAEGTRESHDRLHDQSPDKTWHGHDGRHPIAPTDKTPSQSKDEPASDKPSGDSPSHDAPQTDSPHPDAPKVDAPPVASAPVDTAPVNPDPRPASPPSPPVDPPIQAPLTITITPPLPTSSYRLLIRGTWHGNGAGNIVGDTLSISGNLQATDGQMGTISAPSLALTGSTFSGSGTVFGQRARFVGRIDPPDNLGNGPTPGRLSCTFTLAGQPPATGNGRIIGYLQP